MTVAARFAVAVALLASVIATTGGCASSSSSGASATKPTSTRVARGTDVLVSETSASELTHAHLRPRISPAGVGVKPATMATTIDGIFVLPTNPCRPVGGVSLSGVKTATLEPSTLPMWDPPEAQTAYCFAAFGSGDTDFSQLGAPSAEIDEEGSWVRADRLERTGKDKTSFHMFTLWADDVGRLQRLDEAMIPLVPLGSFAGTSVFGFIDDDGIATKGKPSAVVIIQRPPLKRWRVQGTSFLVSTPSKGVGLSSCTHAWMTLPLEKGNGTIAQALVGIETETGARVLRINVSSLWLESQRDARLTTRLQWFGEEDDTIDLTRLRSRAAPPPPVERDTP